MTDKQQYFLLIVQTMFLANAVNIRPDDPKGVNRHTYSSSAAYMFMDEAVEACTKIPHEMTASLAANEFAGFMLDNTREDGAVCPSWFARG